MARIDVNHDKWITPAKSMRSLLSYSGEDFVECAYFTILDRAPDERGLAHYAEQLHNGKSKIEVIRALYGSEEARQHNKTIPWLRWGLLISRITGFPASRVARLIQRNKVPSAELLSRIRDLELVVSQLQRDLVSEKAKHSQAGEVPPLEHKAPQQEFANPKLEPDLSGRSLVTKRVFAALMLANARRHGSGN